ncbi:MAG: Ig domain-containing protein [Bacteroidales bacterium]|nr:Ig domain-containing protein [Candidatus Equimonas faecalis]
MSTFNAQAQEYRLYINDFEIQAGETQTVSVILDNGTKGFAGFQTDIALPQGLSLVETYDEEEETTVAFFLNAGRKKSKHDISYALQTNGAYRVLGGGNGTQTYTGTSDTELFNFQVTASANFTGTGTIRLFNTLFTDPDLAGYNFPDEACTVSAKSVQYTITAVSSDETMGSVTGGGSYKEGASVTLTATPKEGYKFVKWSDDTTVNPYIFNATKDMTITAFFASNKVVVSSISVTPSTASLTVGDTQQLSATISPSNATNKNVTWSSGNTSIATVSSTGLVTAKAAGTVTIKATAADGSGVYGSCTVTIKNSTIAVSSISVTPSTASLTVGTTKQLSATVSPSNATNKNVTWSSSNTSIATVSSAGLVTAKAAGTVTIKATAADGSGVYGSCTVTVTNVIPPTNTYTITVTSSNTSMGTVSGSGTYESGQTVTVKATPASGYRFVKWSDGSVQNPYTFTAIKDISLTATFAQTTPSDVLGANDVKPNKSYIIYTDVRGGLTVRAQNDTRIWGTSEGDVNQEVSLSNTFQHFAFIKQGDNLYLYNVATKKYVSADLQGTLTDQPSAPITFADASNGTVRLVFDASHNINLGGSKQVLIDSWTYKDDGNSFRIIEAADFYNGLVTNVTVSPSTASLAVGDTQQLSATVSPSNATNKNVTWSSGNTSIATVLSTGLVTAKAAGTVTIKATAADGSGVYGSCTVTIKNSTIAVSSISVTPSTASLTVGTTKQLSATVSPSNATNKNVTWSSSNTSIATVSSTGLVTAKAAGKVTIKATAADGSGVYGSCTITITNEDDKYNREPSSPTTFNINQFDNVYVEEDSSDGRSYSWISLVSSDYVIYLLAFTSSQSDTGIAPGTYPINSSYMEGTILASPGRNDGGDSPSAIVTDFVEGEDGNMHYQTVYYIVSGTFTVAKEKNGVRMTLNAKTFYGSTINASFVGGNADGIFSAFTPKDTPTSTKKVLNGHQLLIKNGSRTWDVHGRLLN